MLPSWNRCFSAADVFLLLTADLRILLQSTPASLSATCINSILPSLRWRASCHQASQRRRTTQK